MKSDWKIVSVLPFAFVPRVEVVSKTAGIVSSGDLWIEVLAGEEKPDAASDRAGGGVRR